MVGLMLYCGCFDYLCGCGFLDYLWVVIISFDGFLGIRWLVLISYGLLLLDAFVVVFTCTIWFGVGGIEGLAVLCIVVRAYCCL